MNSIIRSKHILKSMKVIKECLKFLLRRMINMDQMDHSGTHRYQTRVYNAGVWSLSVKTLHTGLIPSRLDLYQYCYGKTFSHFIFCISVNF